MPADVVVTAFQSNPSPAFVNQQCHLDFTFHNQSDEPTPDDHVVFIVVTDPVGNTEDFTIDVVLAAAAITNAGAGYDPGAHAGLHQVNADPQEGQPYNGNFPVNALPGGGGGAGGGGGGGGGGGAGGGGGGGWNGADDRAAGG